MRSGGVTEPGLPPHICDHLSRHHPNSHAEVEGTTRLLALLEEEDEREEGRLQQATSELGTALAAQGRAAEAVRGYRTRITAAHLQQLSHGIDLPPIWTCGNYVPNRRLRLAGSWRDGPIPYDALVRLGTARMSGARAGLTAGYQLTSTAGHEPSVDGPERLRLHFVRGLDAVDS